MSVPERIGRYRLGPRLGSGGFAVVWLAHDESLDTQIAIKVLADNWSHQLDVRDRFLAEARMLRQAASPRVVQVFDIGELADGRPYFVMEYADRGTLADRTRTGPVPLEEALRLTTEVAKGVAELHRAGIVHRDLKPSNVLIRSSPDGPDRLLVADLGFAKSLAQATGLTMGGGSAGYTAPEQTVPGIGVDVRADVYSLGALGYHLATGRTPGPPGQVIASGRNGSRLPAGVMKVLARALETDRERRWPDVATMIAALERQLARLAPGRPPRRRRAVTAGVGVLVVAGAGVGAATVLHERSTEQVRVQDASGRLSLEVPRSWAGQLVGGGWRPALLGLSGASAAGLIVADTTASWPDLGRDVDGVFAGLSDDAKLPAAVAGISHPGCRFAGERAFSGNGWTGRVRQFDACSGGLRSIDEISLTPVQAGEPWVYVQIRRHGQDATDPGPADRVLRSVRATE